MSFFGYNIKHQSFDFFLNCGDRLIPRALCFRAHIGIQLINVIRNLFWKDKCGINHACEMIIATDFSGLLYVLLKSVIPNIYGTNSTSYFHILSCSCLYVSRNLIIGIYGTKCGRGNLISSFGEWSTFIIASDGTRCSSSSHSRGNLYMYYYIDDFSNTR